MSLEKSLLAIIESTDEALKTEEQKIKAIQKKLEEVKGTTFTSKDKLIKSALTHKYKKKAGYNILLYAVNRELFEVAYFLIQEYQSRNLGDVPKYLNESDNSNKFNMVNLCVFNIKNKYILEKLLPPKSYYDFLTKLFSTYDTVNVGKGDVFGNCPLHFAAGMLNLELFEILLNKNPDAIFFKNNKRESSGKGAGETRDQNPLLYACHLHVEQYDPTDVNQVVVLESLKKMLDICFEKKREDGGLLLSDRSFALQQDGDGRNIFHYLIHLLTINEMKKLLSYLTEAQLITVFAAEANKKTPIDILFENQGLVASDYWEKMQEVASFTRFETARGILRSISEKGLHAKKHIPIINNIIKIFLSKHLGLYRKCSRDLMYYLLTVQDDVNFAREMIDNCPAENARDLVNADMNISKDKAKLPSPLHAAITNCEAGEASHLRLVMSLLNQGAEPVRNEYPDAETDPGTIELIAKHVTDGAEAEKLIDQVVQRKGASIVGKLTANYIVMHTKNVDAFVAVISQLDFTANLARRFSMESDSATVPAGNFEHYVNRFKKLLIECIFVDTLFLPALLAIFPKGDEFKAELQKILRESIKNHKNALKITKENILSQKMVKADGTKVGLENFSYLELACYKGTPGNVMLLLELMADCSLAARSRSASNTEDAQVAAAARGRGFSLFGKPTVKQTLLEVALQRLEEAVDKEPVDRELALQIIHQLFANTNTAINDITSNKSTEALVRVRKVYGAAEAEFNAKNKDQLIANPYVQIHAALLKLEEDKFDANKLSAEVTSTLTT